MSVTSKYIIKILEADGWYKYHQKGSHCHYKHLVKSGRVTVPRPKKDLPRKTVESIYKQAKVRG